MRPADRQAVEAWADKAADIHRASRQWLDHWSPPEDQWTPQQLKRAGEAVDAINAAAHALYALALLMQDAPEEA